MAAIPTRYAGVQFRSRLEARWAAFFDLLRWDWDYEPVDLNGYIPDFVLAFKRPLLVEVKPIMDLTDCTLLDAADKIRKSGWGGESIVVGARLFFGERQWLDGVIGRFAVDTWCQPGRQPANDGSDSFLDNNVISAEADANLFSCGNCKMPSLCHSTNGFYCRVNGCWDGDHQLSGGPSLSWQVMWREAGNIVQWRGERV